MRRLDASIEYETRQTVANANRAGIEHIVRPPHQAARAFDALERFFRGGGDRAVDVSFGEYRASAPDGVVNVEKRDVYGYTGGGSLTVQNPSQSGRMYEVMLDGGAIWRLGPEIVQTASGNPVRWPKMTAAGTLAAITPEGTAIAESDPILGSVTTTPNKYAALTQLSTEVISDSAVNVLEFVARHASYSLERTYGPHMATGSGTGQPQGYITGATVGIQAAGTCSPESAIRLQHTVNQRYRQNAKWATNDGVLGYWLPLHADAGGTTGPWLVQPPSAPGAPETFMGAAVNVDPNITAHGSAVKSVCYGDFANGYLVHDAGMRFERSDDFAFANDLMTFRAAWRLDGRVRDANALAVYQATAS